MVVARSSWLMALGLTGCLGGLGSTESSSGLVVAEGSREATALLDFLNAEERSVDELVSQAGVRRSAATSILSHRLGPDATWGTDDDDPLDSIRELLDLRAVGNATVERLMAYVVASGALGDRVIEGVAFWDSEIDAVLEVASLATREQLDGEAQLDRRAVGAILLARPFSSVDALAAVPWVGPSALTKLRDYAPSWVPPVTEGCVLVAATDEAAADYSRLLAIATTNDWPYGRVIALHAEGCADTEEDRALLAEALWCAAFGRCGDADLAHLISEPTPGGEAFSSLLGDTRQRIDERVADGAWDPAETEEGAALYPRLDELLETLRAPALESPESFLEVRLDLDAEECSEAAVARGDLRDGTILLVHRFPRC